MMWTIVGLVFFLLLLGVLGAVLVTVWWLWRRATVQEGEPAPKWGDLRSLRAILGRQSIIARMAAVAIIAGLMTIPLGFIYDLTLERNRLYGSVVQEISSTWGDSQILTGPVLSVPYTVRYQVAEEVPLTAAEFALEQSRGGERTTKRVVRDVEEEHAALVLPEDLSVDGKISTELRSRTIYSTRVYTADMKVSGNFRKSDLFKIRQNVVAVHWDKATFVVGITSTKSIRSISDLEFAGHTYTFLPGTGGLKVLPTGFSVEGDLSGEEDGEMFSFDFDVSVNGSGRLYLTPIGVSSVLKLSSDWPHPNFTGSGLPSSRSITQGGFSAEWDIPNLVRNYPQFDDVEKWDMVSEHADSSEFGFERTPETGGHRIREYIVGVEFFEPVFHYSLLIRAVKYGMLFIALIFLGVVIFEHYYAKKTHIWLNMAQYIVIGAGLSIFYLILLAASEHIAFTPAYILASVLNVAMTSGYVMSALRQSRPAMLTAVVQGMLYALLFFILRMEDYALLGGTTLLVAGTIALMFVTRNINRPDEGRKPE
ncbi:MAG: cell envelope integrity protein CreD [Synergistaceae bacterium]|jgi:inner membrane protein|nr:cell envelope integrity protein CreD [Synergistaceae bacterium]